MSVWSGDTITLQGEAYSLEASEIDLRPGEEPTGFVHAGIIFRDAQRLFRDSKFTGWRLTSDCGDTLTIFND